MAFDFEKLEVYSKAKVFNRDVSLFLEEAKLSRNKRDQLERAAFSIMLDVRAKTVWSKSIEQQLSTFEQTKNLKTLT